MQSPARTYVSSPASTGFRMDGSARHALRHASQWMQAVRSYLTFTTPMRPMAS